MVRTPHMTQTGPVQETLPFQRPRLDLEVPAQRTRHRKGRIRRALKKTFLTGFFLAVLGSAAAIAGGWADPWIDRAWEKTLGLSVEAGFALETISTKGLVKTPESTVIEVLALAPGDPLFGFDIEDLQTRVETLPWVRSAVISRELPATLKVFIQERHPFARWQTGGTGVLVDETGAVIKGVPTADYPELPFIVGPGAPEAAASLYGLLATTPDLASRVVAAVRVGQRRWDLEFDNGLRLKLPEQGERYGEAEAWQAFIDLNQEKAILTLGVSIADLRLPGRVVLRLTPEGRKAFENRDQKT